MFEEIITIDKHIKLTFLQKNPSIQTDNLLFLSFLSIPVI